jgi:CheY-like chemotaxis protein
VSRGFLAVGDLPVNGESTMWRSSTEWTDGSPTGAGGGVPQRRSRDRRPDVLRQARILIVEDEALVAALLEDRLCALGCDLVGSAATVSEALDLVARERIDAAVLDVNINGEMVFPVADALRDRGIPFVFATAYGAAGVAERHNRHAVLDKPYQERALEHALRAALLSRAAN